MVRYGRQPGLNQLANGIPARSLRARCDAGMGLSFVIGMIPMANWPPELDFYEDGLDAGNTRAHYYARHIMGLAIALLIRRVPDRRHAVAHVRRAMGSSTISYLLDGTVWWLTANPLPTDPYGFNQTMGLFIEMAPLDWVPNNIPITATTPFVITAYIDWAVVYQ